MSCPTVKVKCDNEQGFMIINEDDFDKKNHELFVDNKPEAKPKPKAKAKAKPKA